LRIDVVDTGVGIEPDKLDAVSWNLRALARWRPKGWGWSWRFPPHRALLGARIEVSSNPGRGSRFSLYLPAMTGVAAALPQIPVETPVRRQPCADRCAGCSGAG
jgi:hypothetical protein